MASKSVPISITYASPGAMPPVYVAGDFTGWQAIEMDYTTKDGENHFFKEVHVNAGSKHQYKFRLGPGDWWVLNEDAPTGKLTLLHYLPYLLAEIICVG